MSGVDSKVLALRRRERVLTVPLASRHHGGPTVGLAPAPWHFRRGAPVERYGHGTSST
ncbi:MAG: hypothetical protein ACR2NV_07325 [Thermoleophilaceae bacterium]